MLSLAAALSVAMGTALGLLGGGGSILTVPILVYVVGLEVKQAIATSLLVVGVTSIIGTAQHARRGHVRWKLGIVFGAVAMIGAYAGGRLAAFVDGRVLLVLFAALMIATALAMLGKERRRSAPALRRIGWPKLGAEGLVVGAVTGMVGAGGGFLVVPALALWVGLPIREAIATSLLIIAMKSFAGLGGQLSHAAIDPILAGVVTGFAVLGSLGGAALAARLEPERLRRLFGVFVLGMAGFILFREAPASVRELVLVERRPLWEGGAAAPPHSGLRASRRCGAA